MRLPVHLSPLPLPTSGPSATERALGVAVVLESSNPILPTPLRGCARHGVVPAQALQQGRAQGQGFLGSHKPGAWLRSWGSLWADPGPADAVLVCWASVTAPRTVLPNHSSGGGKSESLSKLWLECGRGKMKQNTPNTQSPVWPSDVTVDTHWRAPLAPPHPSRPHPRMAHSCLQCNKCDIYFSRLSAESGEVIANRI